MTISGAIITAFTLTATLGAQPAGTTADEVTVLLRSGEKVRGQLEDLDQGTVFVRVSLDDQRRLPVGDVAVIDFVGGASGLPESELRDARGDDHLMVLRSSTHLSGRLVDIAGGAGSKAPDEPRVFVFRTAGGEERRVPARDVGRVYVGRYPATGATETAAADLPAGAQRVSVPAKEGWVATGIRVTSGQSLTFAAEGQVRLSTDADDVATADGSTRGRRAVGAPLPTTLAGALIGRVGQTGTPFGIGTQTQAISMPDAGELLLAVNDDDRHDNDGSFTVTIRPATGQVQQRQPRE